MRKGRMNHGEDKPAAKLTNQVAAEILASPQSGPELSKQYGVNTATIGNIKRRKAWAHIAADRPRTELKMEKMRRGPKCKDPRIVKVQIALKLPRWMVAWLNGQPDNRTQLIEQAILRQYRLKPPPRPEPGQAEV